MHNGTLMHSIFELLMLASLVGAVDVLYFHLYRFRLYQRPESVYEELTHLARAGLFIAVVATIAFSDGSPAARLAVVAMIALDLANSVLDVLLERRSRASLGGLPSFEYLLHILGTFLSGAAAALFVTQSGPTGFTPVAMSSFDLVRAYGAIVVGGALLVIEASLFLRACAARGRLNVAAP
jgi:hypothetical protein